MSLREGAKNPSVITPRFIISASAYGIGTIITRRQGTDTFQKVPLQGASVLPSIGGYSIQRLESTTAPDAADFVSFGHLETEADGHFDTQRKADQCYVRTRSSITALSVIGRFKAPFVQSSINLRYEQSGKEPTVSITGTTFGSPMSLDDETIHVHIDDQLVAAMTESAIERLWVSDPKKYRNRFLRGPGRGLQAGNDKTPPRLSRSGYMMVSIVDSIRVYNSKDPSKPTKAKVIGHTVSLDKFGTIYFGEMLVRGESRRLAMMRFELGCPNEGRMAVCGAESVGEFCPP